MEKFVRQNLLYDFYGELLTEHQKKIYELVIADDYSYSEIAKNYNISRQGIYDLVKRCDKILEEYESKLRLVEKFEHTKHMVSQIKENACEITESSSNEQIADHLNKIVALSNAILDEY